MARLEEMEKVSGKKFGDIHNPLLVSARSVAKYSMPGMMDTILNIGIIDKIVNALAVGDNARFWRDSYRRLLQMYGDVVEQDQRRKRRRSVRRNPRQLQERERRQDRPRPDRR